MTVIKLLLIFIALISTQFAASAQEGGGADEYADPSQPQIDSILALITPSTPDSTKAQYYLSIANMANVTDSRIKYAKLSIDCCSETDYDLLGINNWLLCSAYYASEDYKTALLHAKKSIEYYGKGDNLSNVANACNAAALIHAEMRNFDSVGIYMNKALEIGTQLGDTMLLANCYRNLGDAFLGSDFFDEAKSNYRKAIVMDSCIGNTVGYALDINSLVYATIHQKKDSVAEYFAAKDYLTRAVNILDTMPYYDGKYFAYWTAATAYNRLAQKTGNHIYADSSLYYYNMADPFFKAQSVVNYRMLRYEYVDYLMFYKRYGEAAGVMRELEQTFDEYTNADSYEMFHKRYRDVCLALGDYKNAYFHSEKAHEYARIFLNDSTMTALSDMKAQQAVLKEQMEREKVEALHRMERLTLIAVIVALLIVALLIFRVYRVKHKSNLQLAEKNLILDQQKTEIEAQRDEIEIQRDEIATQRNEIVSSVTYAQRIQRAAVSSQSDVHAVFPESFVFYRPRDIVSGDFYRCGRCGKYSVMVTADCTGHGIPGAFLSMLGLSALKEFCVTEYDAANPGTILDRMRDFIKTTLITDSDGKELRDGMDMTICCFDFAAMEMRYAIAQQTAVIVRHGEVISLKGDRMPVGRHSKEKEHFQTFTERIEPGDMVYMFSDGIQDQFGGPESKKFSLRQLIDTLQSSANLPAVEQCSLIEQTISDWRADHPQLDDMTMVGIRVG